MTKKIFYQTNKQSGFTLVELVVVMSVLVLIAGITGAVLSSTLNSANKSRAMTTVRQNGNVTLLQMTKTIQYAKKFKGVSNPGGIDITDCSVIVGAGTPTPMPMQYKTLKLESFDNCLNAACPPITYLCDDAASIISSNSANLIDPSSVAISDCYFTCIQQGASDNPTIGINFTLKQKDTFALFENIASVSFHTAVEMRNSQR